MSGRKQPRPGADRSNASPIWPEAIVRPNIELVYLDLNHWVALAKANSGHRDGKRWTEVLARLRLTHRKVAIVLGLPLIQEIIGIRRRKQRSDLADVIEEFTGFACVLPLTTVASLEFEASLGSRIRSVRSIGAVNLLGRGVLRASGMDGRLRVRDESGADVTDSARARSPLSPQEFDRRLEEGERELDRAILRGPMSDEEEADLESLGWNPAAIREVAVRRAEQERELAARLADEPRWRRGRLRDVVAATYLALEIEDARDHVLLRHKVRLDEVLSSVEESRSFVDSMPAADVWVTLKTALHRSESTVWTPNDIHDVDALSVAASYCDVVVTERAAAHVLKEAGVPARLETEIFTDLEQLVRHLEQ